MTLLRDIQAAALDSKVNLADLLRKCKVLAARLKHQELATWVDHELSGYADSDLLPEYRKIAVMSVGDFVGPYGSGLRNHPIPETLIPESLRDVAKEQDFFEAVSALSAFIDDSRAAGNSMLKGVWPADVIMYLRRQNRMHERMVLIAAWRVIPVAAVVGILDTIRTRILDFALAIENVVPTAGEVAPGEQPRIAYETVTQIYYTTIFGGPTNIIHSPGDLNMGSKHTTNITGSTIGAVAIGKNAQATGSVTTTSGAPLSQEQHRAALKSAQTALLDDQDALDRLDDRLYEALGQFLRMAREIQVEQRSLAEVQAKMKETLDEVWAAHAAKGLRTQLIPETLGVAKEIITNPVMGEVVKALIGT